jgi:hypothetical protein
MRAWRAGRNLPWLVPLFVAACAPYQTAEKMAPVSYAQADDAFGRRVGLLRRMAVLELSQAAPKICDAGTNGHMSVVRIDPVTRRTLQDEKGYELLEVDAAQVPEALVDEVTSWSGPEKFTAGPALTSWIEVQRDSLRADAVLVRLDRNTCPMADPAYRAFMGLGTLGLTELLPPRAGMKEVEVYTVVEAWVFEAKTGRLVWRHSVSPWQTAHRRLMSPPDKQPSPTATLFEPLEAAIPRILTR